MVVVLPNVQMIVIQHVQALQLMVAPIVQVTAQVVAVLPVPVLHHLHVEMDVQGVVPVVVPLLVQGLVPVVAVAVVVPIVQEVVPEVVERVVQILVPDKQLLQDVVHVAVIVPAVVV